MYQIRLFLLTLLIISGHVHAKTISYEFDIDYKTVNMTGTPVRAMAIDNSIPAPTIEANVGDTLKITFHNHMAVESSIHWHGILLPNDQDGVPYLNSPAIKPGGSLTFEYPVIHHGTYWYHSHTGLQEQRGVYGSIVFHPKQGERVNAAHDLVVVLSDWTNEDPMRVLHNLKKSDDYYAIKKDSVQSWFKVIQHGQKAISNRIKGAWSRMGPMDISDVGYDAFLANGKPQIHYPDIKAGDKVRLRIINAAASSYFNLQFADNPMTVVAVDGVDVDPVRVTRQRIAMAETFDVIITMPDDGKAYEFRATSEDATGYSSVVLGQGSVVEAPTIAKPNPYLADHSIHHSSSKVVAASEHDQMSGHRHHHQMMNHTMSEMDSVNTMTEYELLRSPTPTEFNSQHKIRTVPLTLTGDMERYAWSFNNQVLSEDSKIMIQKGEVVRFELHNKTMMHHPLHLHGHFFRVLNGQGEYAPLKHTVNVPAMQTVTIEFLADQQKDWFFHCHNLYHMKSGMARIISYQDSVSTPQSLSPLFADLNWFYFADASFQNNFSFGELTAENTRNTVKLEYEWDYEQAYKIEAIYERYINRFIQFYGGWEREQEQHHKEIARKDIGMAGVHYLLPLLIEMDLRIDNHQHGRFGLSNEHQLSNRWSFDWMLNTDDEYRIQLNYEITKQIRFTGGKDDQFDWGMGLQLRY